MPSIVKRFSMAIGTSVDNALANSQYEFAPFDGTIEVGITAVRTLVTCAIFSGPDVLAEPGSNVQVFTPEKLPTYPDDFHYEDEVAHGDRMKVSLFNGNIAAGPDAVNVVFRLTPA
jgi:hypothetical protein